MTAWVLTIALMALAAWEATQVLALTCPHMTTKQRWGAIFWLYGATGCILLAWQVGGRA